jgi:acyl transferase domain-containing protein/predicted O-methyltransferase YrrM
MTQDTMNRQSSALSPTKRALHALQEMRAKVNALERAKTEPIAIIGMNCRFPGGAENPEAFWQLLREGRDAIIEVPKERWDIEAHYDPDPQVPGKIYTRSGGFLDAVDKFDAHFFGISPREAKSMDPQQRLLLEVSWKALENANLVPKQLLGSSTGVFVGITNIEYGALALWTSDRDRIDAYYGTGGSLGVAAGRLSYILGLTGPSFIVDTACSSSLVTTHLACQSLRLGECDLALVGGVNLIYGPETSINFSKARMLSPDGRSKTFDAAADGYGRGEGCGVIVLKRLSDAQRDGDNILAQIRGSAVNQDGPSGGFTVPNGPSQEKVIRQALANGGIEPEQVSYIEAHGTGTSLGDPIEINSLNKVFGSGHSLENPLIVGSVKSNMGHLESAASIAGLIKVVLSLQHKEIPPHLHFKKPNPHIDWDAFPIVVPTSLRPWLTRDRRIAGLSSFSFSGTNAHLVLEEAPDSELKSSTDSKEKKMERPFHLLTLSAKTHEALIALAVSYEQYLSADLDLGDICFTAHTCRSHFQHRLSVIGASNEQMRERLAAGLETTALSQERVQTHPPKIAFLFTGQGSQYINMGQQLYKTQPTFRKTLERCDEILRDYLEPPLLEVLYSSPDNQSKLDETAYTQPALFALEYALAELWQSWGIKPDIVMGHSVGEYVAACIAGVFSLEDGLKFIAERGRLMQTLCEVGDMLVLSADEARVVKAIQPYAQDISIAAINGPENIVISGKREAIQAAAFEGIETRQLKVSHAFHSPLMEPMLTAFEKVAKEITYSSPKISLCSNLSGQLVTDEIATPEYWCRHIRHQVKFAASMDTLYQQGVEVFVEIGPKPTLLGMARQCLPDEVGVWLPSLRFGHDEWQQILESLGKLYVRGVPVDWLSFDRDYTRHRVQLPTYPFQHQRYWLDTTGSIKNKKSKNKSHPLLGERLHSAIIKNKEIVFESLLDSTAFLAHHRIFQTPILPAAAHVEMALAAGVAVFKSEHLLLEDVVIHQALVLPEVKTVQLVLTPAEMSAYTFQIFSLTDDEDSWICHTSGKLTIGQPEPAPQVDLAQTQYIEEISVADYYQQTQQVGIEHGESFQTLEKLWQNQENILGQIQLPKSLLGNDTDFYLHPVLLDGCFQMLGVPLLGEDKKEAYLPVGFERLRVYRRPSNRLWCVMKMSSLVVGSQLMADLRLVTPDGQLIAKVEGMQLQKASRESIQMAPNVQNWLYEVEWQADKRLGLPPDYIPTPTEISSEIAPDVASSVSQLKFYETLLPQLEKVSVAYLLTAIKKMGWVWQLNQHFTTATIVEQLGIISQHQRLLRRLLEILTEEQIIEPQNNGWKVISVPELFDPQAQTNALLAQSQILNTELTLLARCGNQLADVLQGKCDPLQLLFPDGDLSTLTQFYQDSPGPRVMNTLIQKVILSALARLPQGRSVRLLEIGAGTGGTTAYILPHLPIDQTEYVFTDVSSLFTNKAQEKFSDYPFVQYQVLDIEQAPDVQGFGEYDIVVAANVLHATKDLAETVQHIHSLLAPGGLLVLLEGTNRQRWVDLTFGLTEGWWRFIDQELRPDYPLLTVTQWQKLLAQNGFKALSPIEKQQAVLIAQKPLLDDESQPQSNEQWLIFADKQGIAHQLATYLQETGAIYTLILPGETYEQIDEQTIRINPYHFEDFQQTLETVSANQRRLRGVVHCWSLDTASDQTLTIEDLKAAQHNGCGSTLQLIQALGKADFSEPPALWLVTQGAMPIQNTQLPMTNIAHSTLWGMGKVIASEHPELNCVRIDLDPKLKGNEAQALFEEIWSSTIEDQIAFRHNARYVARLVHYHQRETHKTLDAENTYLITGGLGDLGLLIAQWMVEKQGVKHLVLVGRTGAKPNQLKALEAAGASVLVAQADVSSQAQLAKVLADIEQSQPPLRGIIHAAGVLEDGVLASQTWENFEKVFAPKVFGAWNLHTATKHLPLDFFVLFSSVAALLGSPGQANHVAANTFLDALAAYRQAQGLAGMSINWGAWSEIGEAARRKAGALVEMKGMGTISPEQGLTILEHLFSQPTAQVGVMPINWSQFLTQWANVPFFSHFKQEAGSKLEQQADFIKQLESISSDEQHDYLLAHVQSQVAQVLGLNPSQPIDVQEGFFDIGMDSLTSVELKNRLQTSLGRSLPATLLFKYPTVEKLVDYLANEVLTTPSTEEQESDKVLTEVKELSDDALAALIDEEFDALIPGGQIK